MKRFPILINYSRVKQLSGLPKSIPWELIEKHSDQAEANHDQSIATLARRGGLCPEELALVLEDKRLFPAIDNITLDESIEIIKKHLAEIGE